MPVSVLIVDDDPSFRAVAGELLRARGFEVAGVASHAAEAVAAVRRLRPGAVLLDIHLPDDHGSDVVPALRSDRDGPRILLTSSDPLATTDELARQCGAVGFVPKTELAIVELTNYLGA
jgi:CheY-like chemotaxis protein